MPSTSQTGYQSSTQTGTQNTSATLPGIAAEENLSAIPGLGNLTELINSINRSAQTQANASRLPGGAGLEQKSSANINAALSGQLPADIKALLGQSLAERGVSSGVNPTSPNANAAYIKALVGSGLNMQGLGQSWLSAAAGRNPTAPLFDLSHFLNTPSQAGTTTASTGTNYSNTGQNASYPEQAQPTRSATGPTGGMTVNPGGWVNSMFGGNGWGSTGGWSSGSTWQDGFQYDPETLGISSDEFNSPLAIGGGGTPGAGQYDPSTLGVYDDAEFSGLQDYYGTGGG